MAAEPKTELEKDVFNFLMQKKQPQASNIIIDSKSVGSDSILDDPSINYSIGRVNRVNASPMKGLGMKKAAEFASPN